MEHLFSSKLTDVWVSERLCVSRCFHLRVADCVLMLYFSDITSRGLSEDNSGHKYHSRGKRAFISIRISCSSTIFPGLWVM